MQFRILGPLEMYDDRQRRGTPLTSPKQQLLLGALLARPGRLVPVEDLVRELWGARPPSKAGNALQAHVSRLRQAMAAAEPGRTGAPRLVARTSGYLLRARPEEVDSSRFRLGVHRARALAGTDPEEAYTVLRQALGLWRGTALAGCRGPIGAALADRLERERLGALEAMFDLALHTGQHRRVVPELREAVLAHPAHGRFRAQLRRALTRGGGLRAEHRGSARPRHRVHTVAGGRGDDRELDRLRALVDRIALDQHALQSAIEQLSALVGGRTAA